MRQTAILLSLTLAAPVLAQDAAPADPPRYRISVSGPVAELVTSCDDPCEIDEVEVVGRTSGRLTTSQVATREQDANPEEVCQGNCDTGRQVQNMMVFSTPRTLREGLSLTIRDGRAHFIFHSVTETESGPATLLQHSEFRVDRPFISVYLHGHDVVVRTDMEEEG